MEGKKMISKRDRRRELEIAIIENILERTTKNRSNISGYDCGACKSYREWLEDFEKQERKKQELSDSFIEQIARKTKVDFDEAVKRNPNFCYGYLRGFREGYLKRGKEILG